MGGKLSTQTYLDAEKVKGKAQAVRDKLKLKQLEAKRGFSAKHPQVEKYLKKKGVELSKVREHSARVIGAGAIAGALLLSPPRADRSLPAPHEIVDKLKTLGETSQALNIPKKVLLEGLKEILPEKPRPLTRDEEKTLERLFEEVIGVSTRATLEGEHLNTTYGYIGAEQHLRRYPGDVLGNHAPESDDYGSDNPAEILKEGIAPGLGAWGYFAPSEEALTGDLEETERWYAVVQTLYLPDWGKRQPYLRDWYKYRKVLIVNTKNGNAVVAAIADSGPAAWTGKHFGGSPEVMDYLGGSRYKKGAVLLFFVDDPQNKVPLGPVDYSQLDLSGLELSQG
jgi:hypothetical protein